MKIDLRLGDCIEVLKTLPDNSVDSIVTDPPYGIGFMNKEWDNPQKHKELIERESKRSEQRFEEGKSPAKGGFSKGVQPGLPIGGAKEGRWFQEWCEEWATECFRVLKPGGHILSFSAPRTYHRMATAFEEVGFQVRDQIMWVFGSGFPKSHNIGKAIDKFGGNNLLVKEIGIKLKESRTSRGLTLKQADELFCNGTTNYNWLEGRKDGQRIPNQELFDNIVEEWTELKELRDKVVSSERELLGVEITNKTVMQKIGDTNVSGKYERTKGQSDWEGWGTALKPAHEPICMARKPLSEDSIALNVLKWGTGGINIDGSRVGFGENDDPRIGKGYEWESKAEPFGEANSTEIKEGWNTDGRFPANIMFDEVAGKILDEQSDKASRFFYCPKVSKKERNAGLEDLEEKLQASASFRPNHMEKALNGEDGNPFGRYTPTKNIHPTVKPIALMEYLIKLVTPKGGVVLEPFMGSGSTGIAAKKLGMSFIGIEKEEEYMEIAKRRIDNYETI